MLPKVNHHCVHVEVLHCLWAAENISHLTAGISFSVGFNTTLSAETQRSSSLGQVLKETHCHHTDLFAQERDWLACQPWLLRTNRRRQSAERDSSSTSSRQSTPLWLSSRLRVAGDKFRSSAGWRGSPGLRKSFACWRTSRTAERCCLMNGLCWLKKMKKEKWACCLALNFAWVVIHIDSRLSLRELESNLSGETRNNLLGRNVVLCKTDCWCDEKKELAISTVFTRDVQCFWHIDVYKLHLCFGFSTRSFCQSEHLMKIWAQAKCLKLPSWYQNTLLPYDCVGCPLAPGIACHQRGDHVDQKPGNEILGGVSRHAAQSQFS